MDIHCLHFSQLFTSASGGAYPLLQQAFQVITHTKGEFTFVNHFTYGFAISFENGRSKPLAAASQKLRINRACPLKTPGFYYKFSNYSL